MKNLKVAVFMVTFNHEKYIGQAIESVLMQETTFPIKIIIGEDCSTDKTASICLKYKEDYPEIIEVKLNQRNIGALNNSKQIYAECLASGAKYIAMLEGDDFWTDPYKLQKQVDFLDLNENFSSSAHQTLVKYESNEGQSNNFMNPPSDVLYTKDLLNGRFFHTASFVFRSSCIKKINIPEKIAAGDRAIFLVCSFFGPVKFFPEPLGVYRKSDAGISQTITYDQIKGDTRMAKWLKSIQPDFPLHEFQMHIHKCIINYSKVIPLYAILWHYMEFLFHASFNLKQNFKEIKKFSIMHLLKKWIYGIYRRVFHSR